MQGDDAIAVPALPPVAPLDKAPTDEQEAARARRSFSLWSNAKLEARLFRRLLDYTRPYKALLFGSWMSTLGYALAASAIPYMVKPIMDDVLIKTQNVGRISAIIILLYALKGLFSYLSTTLVASAGQRAVTDLRNDLYSHVLNQSFAFFNRRTTGTLMSHITTDVEKIQSAVSEIAGDLLKEGLTVIGLLLLLFYLDWKLAAIALFGMPVAFHPLIQFGRRLRSSNETSLRRWRDISEILQETISGFRVVKAFGMEPFETDRFKRAATRLLHVNLKITRTTAIVPPMMEAVGGIAMIGALWYGSREIRTGVLTAGAFTSFLAALFQMYMPIKRLSRVNATLQGALAAGGRIFEVLDTHQEVREAEGAMILPRMTREVEYKDVGFRYSDGNGRVLRRVSFTARPGEMIAIMGTSGAGKTTLVNLLPRFYDVTEGTITIDGVDVRHATLHSLREQIGLVTQETVLFNDTVRANIAYGHHKEVDEARVEAAARAALAHDFILDLPRRYDTVIGERGNRLSGGQRQRLAIARAILKDPPVLILDEATSALDAESERLVQEALANLMKGRTTLVIAHRLATVRKADRILVIDGGQIAEVGTHDELLRRNGIYKRLYDLQFNTEDDAV